MVAVAEEPKNILLIGLGPSAIAALQTLLPKLPPSYRIVAVSASEAYWAIASLRAAVVPGWEKKVVAPVGKVFGEEQKSGKLVLLESTKVVRLEEKRARLDRGRGDKGAEFEGGWVNFEFCIVATGTAYAFPCRPADGASVEEIVSSLQAQQRDLASSSTVLISGGGPVGIEYAGEVAAYYDGSTPERKQKRIVLVHPRERFMEEKEGWKKALGDKVAQQLEELGVEVKLGRRVKVKEAEMMESGRVEGGKEFELDNGEKINADFLFIAYGFAPNSSFCTSLSPSVLNKRKQVITKPTTQIDSPDGRYDHIFAIGDVNDFEERKIAVYAVGQVPTMAHNLLLLLNASETQSAPPSASLLKTHVLGGPNVGLSIGHDKGASQFYGWVIGPWLTKWSKSRHLHVSHFEKAYNVVHTA
ncbi:hypothetical protein JCM11251_007554 [Rhodosporidiobolus azoricus]